MNEKVVVITGVSTGIGASLSETFLKDGYAVCGTVRKVEDAEQLAKQYPEKFTALVMDVTHQESVENAAMIVRDKFRNGIDVLINNAGIAVGGPLLHVPLAEVSYQMQVNVIGVLGVCQAFAQMLKPNDQKKTGGKILMMSSVSGKIGMPFIGPYSASKHALEGLSSSLRRELIKDMIDVIIIGPGAVKTPIWDKSIRPVKEGYEDTSYARAIQTFQKVFVESAIKTGLSPEYLAQQVLKIAKKAKPKTRYSFVAKRLTNWIAPRYLPTRWIDQVLAKQLFSK
ncbi:MAG: short-subunit dehydrogenase [Cyclobacteriaceae bacterium]|jgi:short-subunit dehydrogenase